MSMLKDDFCIRRVLQHEVAAHAMLALLISDYGCEISVPNDDLTHAERVEILKEIILNIEMKETEQ